jgi:hypothetical protein
VVTWSAGRFAELVQGSASAFEGGDDEVVPVVTGIGYSFPQHVSLSAAAHRRSWSASRVLMMVNCRAGPIRIDPALQRVLDLQPQLRRRSWSTAQRTPELVTESKVCLLNSSRPARL